MCKERRYGDEEMYEMQGRQVSVSMVFWCYDGIGANLLLLARYCDADCQKRDWKRHKNECKDGALEELKAALQANEQRIGLELQYFARKQLVKTTPPAIGEAPPAYY